MAARNVGSATPRLKAGDVVSIESTHFDAPGRPGSYSASAPARAFGVVLGPTRAKGCFTVMWRGSSTSTMESHWKHLRLEPEDESVPKQRQGEAATAFRRRLVESHRQVHRAEQVAEGRRRRRHELRVQRHDAEAPPERREGESNRNFNRRERRFANRVRPTLERRYLRHHNAAPASDAAPRTRPTLQPPLLRDHYNVNLPADMDWSQHESDPDVAMLLYHHATGLLNESEDEFVALSDPTDATLETCVADFTAAVSVDVKRVGCAGCGVMKKDDDNISRLKVGPATLHLVRSGPDFERTYRDLSDLGKSAHHVMEVDGALHHVAPLLVGADGVGCFCARCHLPPAENESKGMKYFRFVDRDYGVHFSTHNPINRPRLSMLEEMALSRVLPYVVTVKLTSRSNTAAAWAMRSHAFCLPHDGQSQLERELLKSRPPVVTSALCTAEELVNPLTPQALTYTFIGTKTAYRVLQGCYPTLLQGLAINPNVAAEFIAYHAEAGHPDFKGFRNRLPTNLADVLTPSLEALRAQIVENMAFDDSALINVIEGHMQVNHVSIYVSMYVFIYLSIYVYMYVCFYVFIYVSIYTCRQRTGIQLLFLVLS